MRRRMFLGKIHRATVTHADLEYEGSVTVDTDLLDAAGMLEHEEVHILNVTRGSRLVTYTLASEGGGSLRASGWTLVGEAGGGSWDRADRPRVDKHPLQVKMRWEVKA